MKTKTFLLFCALTVLSCNRPKYFVDRSDDYANPDFKDSKVGIVLQADAVLTGTDSLVWDNNDVLGLNIEEAGISNVRLGASSSSIGTTKGMFYPYRNYAKGENKITAYLPYSDNIFEKGIKSSLNTTQVDAEDYLNSVKSNFISYCQLEVQDSEMEKPVAIHFDNYLSLIGINIETSAYSDWSMKSVSVKSAGKALTGDYTLDFEKGFDYRNGRDSVVLVSSSLKSMERPYYGVVSVFPNPDISNVSISVILSNDDFDFDLRFTSQANLSALVSSQKQDIAINIDNIEAEEIGSTVINLSGKGTSNSYIVAYPGATYTFNATVMGNGYETPENSEYSSRFGIAPGIIPQKLSPKSARILWQSAPNLISNVILKNNKIYFTSNGEAGGTLVPGNALIAVYSGDNATGNILWSWHLWVTADDIDKHAKKYVLQGDKSGTIYDNAIVMDRNLGALSAEPYSMTNSNSSFGLKYQWGRKDPFPSSNDASATSVSVIPTYDYQGNGLRNRMSSKNLYSDFVEEQGWYSINGASLGRRATIEASIMHPTQFITSVVDSLSNWIYSDNGKQPDDLWGSILGEDNLGHKTIYDPCPQGWRVANGFAYTGFTQDGNTAGSAARDKWNSTTQTPVTYNGLYFYTGGWQDGQTHYYPASGYLTGGLSRIGYGYYWTSLPYSTTSASSLSLQFDANNIYPKRSNSRYIGMPVRCMKETDNQ